MANDKRAKTKKYLVLKSGDVFEIIADKGKYYKCESTQFRKSNSAILKVETRKEAKEKAEAKPEEDTNEESKENTEAKEVTQEAEAVKHAD